MVTSYEAVRAVFEKSPESRQDFEVRDLMPWFRKHISLFYGLKSDALYEIIKYAEFTSKKSDEIIIKQGDSGDCMYILLRGKVTVYHQYNKSDSDDRPSLLPNSGASKSESLRHSLGTFVTHIGPGIQFGEVALIKEDIRSASILTEDPSDLVVIHRDLYNRSIIKFLLEKDFAEKTDFINEHPHFQRLVARYKKQMAMALHKKTIPYDSLLQRQGDDADAIYYILRGEVRMSMEPNRHRRQFPKLLHGTGPFSQLPNNSRQRSHVASSSAAAGEEEDNYAALYSNRSGDRSVYSKQLSSSSSSPSAATFDPALSSRQSKQPNRPLETCLLCKNESIGEFELLLGLTSFIQSTTSTQKTEVLVLELKHFERILLRRNPRIIESMKSGLELRLAARICSRKVERSVPLLLRLMSMAQDSAEELSRREAARVSDRLRRRRRQAEGKTTTLDHSKRSAVGNLPSRTSWIKADAAVTTGELEAETEASGGEMGGDGGPSTRVGCQENMDTVPLSSEEMLTELENRMGSFITSISAESSSSTAGTNSRNQSPFKMKKMHRAITPVDGVIRPGVTVIFRPKSTAFPGDDVNHTNSYRNEGKCRLQYYKMALTSLVPNFKELPVDAKPKA